MLRQRLAAVLFAALATGGVAIGADPNSEGGARAWHAGPFSFSDELGGFVIHSVSGEGTREAPVVLVEELYSPGPVTIVIRNHGPLESFVWSSDSTGGNLHLRIIAINRSGHAWLGLEFELQEVLRQPSPFGDGLSFDQRRMRSRDIGSDTFRRHERQFEPHDRLLFLDGSVDPGMRVSFRFAITDITPAPEFYLLQDPHIPAS